MLKGQSVFPLEPSLTSQIKLWDAQCGTQGLPLGDTSRPCPVSTLLRRLFFPPTLPSPAAASHRGAELRVLESFSLASQREWAPPLRPQGLHRLQVSELKLRKCFQLSEAERGLPYVATGIFQGT